MRGDKLRNKFPNKCQTQIHAGSCFNITEHNMADKYMI